jgi:integrase/recombinase XerD
VLRGYRRDCGICPLRADRDGLGAWLDSRALSPRGRLAYLQRLAAFFRWAMDEGLAATDPTRRIPRPRLPRRLPRPVETAALARALLTAGPRMRVWLCLGAYAGLRVMEIAALRWEHLDLGGRPPMLYVACGKGGASRWVPLSPETASALASYGLASSGPLWANPRGGPLSASYVGRRLSEHLRASGTDASAHQLRHWFGTQVCRATRDLRLTAELMGHASATTTMGYAQVRPESGAWAVAGLHDLTRGAII